MLLLTIDTAGVMRTTCALARGIDDWIGVTVPLSPAEALAPAIEDLLQKFGCASNDISDVVCGIGPGPFTGLRIGLAHAHAVAQVLGITPSGVSSLAAIAARVPQAMRPERYLVASDARRKEVYCAVFDSSASMIGPPQVITPAVAAEQFAGLLVVGDGAKVYSEVFTAAGCAIADDEQLLSCEQALVMAAHDAVKRGPVPALPEYMREPDAVPTAAR
ncbi:MAG: tRNA (adenosine(37)-N6)-threonylcarbamoyltransferase complex dimerization subunit type 1 TsaB [Actinobacteria bacterium]|nr:tRNA (adenosine(37)-N6)-threonylcarbamoyltransferase complex dimerization subunit type 1 TsaB [Actinomycetota bacterium]